MAIQISGWLNQNKPIRLFYGHHVWTTWPTYQQFGARDYQQLFFLIKRCIQILSFDPCTLVKVRYSRVFIITRIDLWNTLASRDEVDLPIQGGAHFSIRERERDLKYFICHTFFGSFLTIVYIIKERILTLGEFSPLFF